MKLIALFVALGLGASAHPGARKLTLKVGERVPVSGTAIPANPICDDLTVVSVDGRGKAVVLTGTRPGATLCSFDAPNSGKPGAVRILYEVEVVAK